MLNFWHRVTTLPDSTLVKKALLENIELRTNWIITIEKLVNRFKLADKIGNHEKFKQATKHAMDKTYAKFWEREIRNPNSARLSLYKDIKKDLKWENYLDVDFEYRKVIAKIRCSDHCLEIEKGRHRNIPRDERTCKTCRTAEIETEEHFLVQCNTYNLLRNKFDIGLTTTVHDILRTNNPITLGKYLIEALALRESVINAS